MAERWGGGENIMAVLSDERAESNYKWGTIPHFCFKLWGIPSQTRDFRNVLNFDVRVRIRTTPPWTTPT